MNRLFAFICFFIIIFFQIANCEPFVPENTADNPRLINLTPQQYRCLDTIEKRIYNNSFWFDNTMDRIERLEMDMFNEIQKGNPIQRLNTLRLESTRFALRGTAMTPMMDSTFNSKYINPKGGDIPYHEDVGIIDGLVRLWWPDFYEQITEYRKYKEANFW